MILGARLAPWLKPAPAAFLVGFALTFAALSGVGRVVAGQLYFENFHRIHRYINPETLFYPTASELVTLARVRSSPDQILVILGGSSVSQGAAMGADELWSDELARQLGSQYAVLNFALPAGGPTEHGAVAAQALQKLGYKVIYYSDTRAAFLGEPDGLLNKYVYWDALMKGLIDDDPARAARLADLASRSTNPDPSGDLLWRSRLDSWFYFTDLWAGVGYEYFFTVWNYLMSPAIGPFTEARRLVSDPLPHVYDPPPVDQRVPAANVDVEMGIMRSFVGLTCSQQPDGTWAENTAVEAWPEFQADVAADFPSNFRGKSLLVIMYYDPVLVERLSPSEKACYIRSMTLTTDRLNAAGYNAGVVGSNYLPEDYNDRTHLVGIGGKKYASDVAPLVRNIAKAQGYVQ